MAVLRVAVALVNALSWTRVPGLKMCDVRDLPSGKISFLKIGYAIVESMILRPIPSSVEDRSHYL